MQFLILYFRALEEAPSQQMWMLYFRELFLKEILSLSGDWQEGYQDT